MHQLTAVDWSWIIGFLLVAFGLSLYHARKSSQSIENYFVAGKNTPWWILGTSIVATTFAADTPLVICGLVITQGVSGNWYWWAVVPSGMLGVFFFAKLWRRSGCLTQAEFAIIRYGPERAPVLRLFYVFYHGVLRNAMTLGFVNLAMAKIITICTPFGKWEALSFCFILTVVCTILGGINGVMWTDFVQFFLAIGSAIGIAYFAVASAGGLEALSEKPLELGGLVRNLSGSETDYFPDLVTQEWWAFIIYLTLYWIACTSTDCNGYAVQRLLSAKNEKHAVWGYLWYNVAHFVLRSWPWILVGMAVMLLPVYADSDKSDPEKFYVLAILEACPAWLIGPALASLLAAYMSTMDTHLNWGASYLVNDFYKPYVNPNESPKHYIYASHVATVVIALAGLVATSRLGSIIQGWGILYGLLSGMGIVGILRWLWWRVTAWTEIGCMIGAGLATGAMQLFAPHVLFPFTLVVIVPVSVLGAAIGTFAFAPEPRNILVNFANRVRPPGPGWNIPIDLPSDAPVSGFPVIVEHEEDPPSPESAAAERVSQARNAEYGMGSENAREGLLRPTICWAMGTAAIYCAMFGVGDLLLKSKVRGAGLCAAALVLAIVVGLIYRSDDPEGDQPAEHVA